MEVKAEGLGLLSTFREDGIITFAMIIMHQ